MVRNVVASQLERGAGPRTIAVELVGGLNVATGVREGGFIGLTDNQARYVQKARKQLESLDSGYFTRALRDKRYDRVVLKAIKSGKPLSKTDIDNITGRYRSRLLKYRAETIARSESITALRAGQHEAYRQLVATGKIQESQIERTWDATGDKRTRFDHALMDGQKVTGLSMPFVAPDGSMLMYPSDTSLGAKAAQTVMCRCIEKIKINYRKGLTR